MGFKLRYIKKYMSFFLDFLRDVNQKTVFFVYLLQVKLKLNNSTL